MYLVSRRRGSALSISELERGPIRRSVPKIEAIFIIQQTDWNWFDGCGASNLEYTAEFLLESDSLSHCMP